MAQKKSLFASGKAKWLLENARKLTPDQRALLLAMADLDVQVWPADYNEERAALDELAAQSGNYDPEEIAQAMKHMVEAEPKRKVVDWPKGLARKTQ
ncbi:MAG: hypothetical protein U0559_02235 [Anaerolineae bacterium]